MFTKYFLILMAFFAKYIMPSFNKLSLVTSLIDALLIIFAD